MSVVDGVANEGGDLVQALLGQSCGGSGETLAAFAIGISEFVLVGLLPAIAADVHVDIATGGMLVTFYALAITVGSPLLTSRLSRYDSRMMLTGLMTLFALGNLAVAVSPNLAGLMAGRIIAGAAHDTVFALGAPVAASLVPRRRRVRRSP